MDIGNLPGDFLGLALVVLLLGMKHGFDADHLAAIDGMTRHNASQRPRLARLAGLLFSLGHGLVVVSVALAVSLLSSHWQPPGWLQVFGAWVSIAVLTALALLNIRGVWQTPPGHATALVGWRSGVFARLLRARHPALVMGVGVLFALSFDTVSQATLFAVTAAQYGGWQPALLLAALFITGMLVTDGLNGWWIARLVRRSDQLARVASRVMALAVAGVSLLTAGMGLTVLLLPGAQHWKEGKELWFGAAVIAVLMLSYGLGQRLGQAEQRTRARRMASPAAR